jgi:phage shock protein A
MSLLHRITRLFKADIHGILDALEEPDVMLKQAVREMQEEIEQSEAQLKTAGKQLERFEQKIPEQAAALARFEEQIDFCFAENNEILAKTLLRKKLETRQSLQALEKRRQALLDEKVALESELAGRRDKLQSILDKMALFTDRSTDAYPAAFDANNESVLCNAVTQEDVELAYLKEKRQRLQRQTSQEQRP